MTLRAVFDEQDDAVAVAARLTADGFTADVEREKLAGEDDDEGHPWAVVTDAPEFLVDLLVEQHDGWLDHQGDLGHGHGHGAAPADVPPLDLPDQPRRIKGHFPRD